MPAVVWQYIVACHLGTCVSKSKYAIFDIAINDSQNFDLRQNNAMLLQIS